MNKVTEMIKNFKNRTQNKHTKAYLKMIEEIETENDFKDAVITISEGCSDYKISWNDFMDLRDILKVVRVQKGFKWGAGI